ncbi:MAG: ZIP family metal transporter [Cytophagaceae bacterium]|nr:ZIP family metal transporter [Gemmatimonadaceae bacterium]
MKSCSMAGARDAPPPEPSHVVITWSASLTAVALVSAIPLAVMLLVSWPATGLQRVIPKLVPVAAGALLGAAVFHLLPEALSAGDNMARVMATLVLGMGVFYLVDRLAHRHERPEFSAERATDAEALRSARGLVPLAMAGDALHNVIDGMLIAAAFINDASLGLLTGAAIALHELPRELGTFALLVRSGMSVRRALAFNALTAAGAIAGAVATLALGTRVSGVGTALIPFAAGNFLYLAAAIAMAEYRVTTHRGEGLPKVGLALLGLLVTAATLRH